MRRAAETRTMNLGQRVEDLVQESGRNTGHWISAGEWSRGGLTISCAEERQKHGTLDLGRHVEERWCYYLLCRRLPHNLGWHLEQKWAADAEGKGKMRDRTKIK